MQYPYDFYVGASLQTNYRVTLGGANHGGVTVTVTSGDASKLRLAPNATTAGSGALDLTIPNGQTTADFYVQGVRGAGTADVPLTATQTLFTTATATVKVRPPVLQIQNLPTTTTTLSADTEFLVYTYILNANGTTLSRLQNVSAEGLLPVTFTSSNAAVGVVKKTGSSGASVTIDIPAGQYYSPTTVATGGVAFDPLTGGTTTVNATAPGFNNSWAGAAVAITVSQPGITLSDMQYPYDFYVGGGLQTNYRVTLGGSEHGGVTLRIASQDTIRLLVSPNATTTGAAFIDVFIPNGQTTADFYVQGINGVTGNVALQASSPLFTTNTTTVQIVQAAVQVINLPGSINVSAADAPFWVQTGILNAGGTSMQRWQNVSPAGAIHVLLSSNNEAVGQLRTAAEYGNQVTVDVPVGSYYSPTTVNTGGVAFDPLTTGTTTVSTSVIGFDNTWPGASVTVTVSP
jgi:hypothetical protein